MQLDLILDKKHMQQLEYLIQETHVAAPDVLIKALDFYYQEILKEHQTNAAQILHDTGFIGSLDAEAEYSENYKQTLAEALESKHGYRG